MSGRNGVKYIKMDGKRYIVVDGTQFAEEYANLLSLLTEYTLVEQGFCKGILTEEEKKQIRISKWKETEGETEGQICFEEGSGESRTERTFHYKFKRGLYLSTESGRTYEPELLEKLRRWLYEKRGRSDVYKSHLEGLDSENSPRASEIEVDENNSRKGERKLQKISKSLLKK